MTRKVIDLETYKQTRGFNSEGKGIKTERVIRVNTDYLSKRERRYCYICERETLHDPINGVWKCCSCDMLCKDTDLGVVYWMDGWKKP